MKLKELVRKIKTVMQDIGVIRNEDQYLRLKERLKKAEGFYPKAYKCPADKLTIGYGRNIEDNGITKEEAEYLLENDIATAIRETKGVFGDFNKFSSARQNALVDMMFNMGKPTFLKFKRMISAIKEKDWQKASIEAKFSRWYNQVGDRAKRIVLELKEG